MQIRNNFIPLSEVKHCHDGQTVQGAMDFLESVGFRCIPVLNQSTGEYLGNIYLVNIYRYLLKEKGQPGDTIENLMDDREVYIHEEEPFVNAFFNIRQYPYLPVVTESKKLTGILTHAKVIDVFQHSWGLKQGGYTITAVSTEYKGALKKFVSVVSQQANIEGLLTLDDEQRLFRRLIVTLSAKNVDDKKIDLITQKLEKNGFRVVSSQEIS
ncbi:MAG TPA: cyclic di-AMP binding protein CbpA [Bacillales bacterium]|nr:cyclic di-AMP binding protein CbpA [Bacillales bacterium]